MSADPRIAIVREWFDTAADELVHEDGSTNIHRALLLIERLDSATPEPSGEEVERVALRPAVAWFAEQMELALRRNDCKGTWEDCETIYLWDRLTEEKRELRLAIDGHVRHPDVTREAADVANFAMMIADAQSGEMREHEWFRPVARAAIAAMRPTGEALGLAKSLRFRIDGIVGSVPESLHRLMLGDARELVALLERLEP